MFSENLVNKWLEVYTLEIKYWKMAVPLFQVCMYNQVQGTHRALHFVMDCIKITPKPIFDINIIKVVKAFLLF